MILSFPKSFRLNHRERYEACFLFGYISFTCVHPEALSGSSRPCKDVRQHIRVNQCWHSATAQDAPALRVREQAKLAQILSKPYCYYVYEAWGLLFPFQKHALLHYLLNRASFVLSWTNCLLKHKSKGLPPHRMAWIIGQILVVMKNGKGRRKFLLMEA